VKSKVQAAALVLGLLGQQAFAQATLPSAPPAQAIPDAPHPTNSLSMDDVAPGRGSTSASSSDTGGTEPAQTGTVPGSGPIADNSADAPPEGSTPAFTLRVRTNFVEVPFSVKDSKGHLVPGLSYRDVRIYENGLRQHMDYFTSSSYPLSVALVVDQSVPYSVMTTVNNALDAIQGAFSPYDEVAFFTYNNGPQMRTTFTAAQGARLMAVVDRSKATGRDQTIVDTSGPLSQNINLNDGAMMNTMPLVNSSHGANMGGVQNVPKEIHTLNDAILMAATSLAKTAKGRRRIIYVISDGKEAGSTAKQKDVIRYLQANNITVWATLVGDTAAPGIGFLDRIHLPLQMRDDVLPRYAAATGGQTDSEYRQRGIERSFAKITEEVRTQYTAGFYSHIPLLDGKYRKLEIKVDRPNLTIISKDGYYPTATELSPSRPQIPATSPKLP
jgi:VWFA-related protein